MNVALGKLAGDSDQITEFLKVSSEKKVAVSFILHALRLVVMSRSAISMCYVKRHNLDGEDQQQAFDSLLGELEVSTEELQTLNKTDWKNHTEDNTEDISVLKNDEDWSYYKQEMIAKTEKLQ